MDRRHLEELIAVERRYWWHVAKRELVLSLLKRYAAPPGLLIEGGIGGAANALAFRAHGYEYQGFDLFPESIEHARSLGLESVQVWDLQEPWPVVPHSARAVVLLDVIEHLPDPVRALANAADALGPNGVAVVTVPAIPGLMGPWDRMLGHHRRYDRPLLKEHAEAAGLRVRWLSSWNSFTLPPAVLVRLLEKQREQPRSAEFPPVSRPINAALIGLARAERAAMRVLPVPVGLSLVTVLQHSPKELAHDDRSHDNLARSDSQ